MQTSETKPTPTPSPPEKVVKLKPLVRKLTLYSAIPPQGILSQLDSGFIAEPSDKATLLSMWEKASQSYNSKTSADRSFVEVDDIRDVEDVDQKTIEKVLSQAKLYPPHDSHQTNIFDVRISKLVTPQLTLNVSRAENRAKIRRDMSTSELFPIMFESAGKPDPITRQILAMDQSNGALIFTSYDEDVRLHHPPQYRNLRLNEKDSKSPTLENVCLAIGGGLPLATALRVPIAPNTTRLILSNGIHRLYRLAAAGYEWCPMIVADVVPMEFPPVLADLPKDVLLLPTSNPPLLTDFLDDEIVTPLDYFTLLRTVQLNWSFSQYVTVLK